MTSKRLKKNRCWRHTGMSIQIRERMADPSKRTGKFQSELELDQVKSDAVSLFTSFKFLSSHVLVLACGYDMMYIFVVVEHLPSS